VLERIYGETGPLLHYPWECKMVQLLWKTVWQFFKTLNIGEKRYKRTGKEVITQ